MPKISKKNIYAILGARPQFIKYAPVSVELSKMKNINELIIHTGQHYDKNMSNIFFEQLKIKSPHENLNVNNVSRGEMIGEMIKKINNLFIKNPPHVVLLFGDTNSTLAGAVAASSFNCEIIHIEAGLRSYNKSMPEEHNRIVADHLSSLLCVTSDEPYNNLLNEGFSKDKIFLTGDVMFDNFKMTKEKILSKKAYLKFNLNYDSFIFATIHRQENTHNKNRLQNIFKKLNDISTHVCPVVLPLHPATKQKLIQNKIDTSRILILNPLDYLDCLSFVSASKFVITDSGGLQKESYYLNKKSLVIRTETEWIELINSKTSFLVNPDNLDEIESIIREINSPTNQFKKNIYGKGNASIKIRKIIENII